MKNIFIISALLLTSALAVYGQGNHFILKGYIKGIQNGKVKLVYDNNIPGININDSAQVKNGFFEIHGRLPRGYPHETLLWLNDSIPTDRFFISTGSQTIHLNINRFYISPETNTPAGNENEIFQQEMQPVEYLVSFYYANRQKIIDEKYHGNPPAKVIDSLKGALENLSLAKDSVMVNFIKNHSQSYVGLWHLFDRIQLMGYRPEIEKAYLALSNHVRNSSLGKLTGEYLYRSKALQPGAVFPALTLLAKDGTTILLKPGEGNKVTLIDFWYSHCSPCIAQFSDLKKLYTRYHPEGFEIVSISTDQVNEIELWHNTIAKYQLPWPQFLDIKQIAGSKLGINVFPYNFLIDNKGRIINKRVTMIQLQNILQKYFTE